LYKFLTSKGLRSILDQRRSAFGSRTGHLEFFLSAVPERYKHHRYRHHRYRHHRIKAHKLRPTRRKTNFALLTLESIESIEMNTKSTISELPALELPAELIEMQEAIDGLSTEAKLLLQPLFQRVLESTNRRRKILQMVQESIGQLRLDMKYLVFDLEATRRERDELQRQASDFSEEEFGPDAS
jgi:hypothetical protein